MTTNSEPCALCQVDHHAPGAPVCRLPAPHLPATAPGANARATAAHQRHHTIEVQARILEYNRESIVALVVRDNARGLDVDPITIHLSLAEAVRVAEMLWGTVGDIRRADAAGRVK